MKQIHVIAEAITIACCRNDLATAQLLQNRLRQHHLHAGILVCEPQSPGRTVDFMACRVLMVLHSALSVRINDLRKNERGAALMGTFVLPIRLDEGVSQGGNLYAVSADRDFTELQIKKILAAIELPLAHRWRVRLHCFAPLSAGVHNAQIIRELDAACALSHGRVGYQVLPEGVPPMNGNQAVLCYTDEMSEALPEPFHKADVFLKEFKSFGGHVALVTERDGRELMYSKIFMRRCEELPGTCSEVRRQDAARLGAYVRSEIIGKGRTASLWGFRTEPVEGHESWVRQVTREIICHSLSEECLQKFPPLARHRVEPDFTKLPFEWEPRHCREDWLTERVTPAMIEARYLLTHCGHPGPWARFQHLIQPGDELWRYADPDPCGGSCCGTGLEERQGVALIREGRIFAKLPGLR